MGASAVALLTLWSRNRFQIHWTHWLDATIDLTFAVGNSGLGLAERALCSSGRDIDLEPPLFILGHWRTGTTLLHELLSLDERLRCPNTYECLLPHHFVLTQRWVKPWSSFALPKQRWFDNMAVGWDRAQEDELALLNCGLPGPYARIAFPNRAGIERKWLDLEGLSEQELASWQQTLLRFCQRLLAVRRGRLVLKSPPHTCRIPALLALFPEARFVYLVRDPQKVIPSTLRMWQAFIASQSYQPFAGGQLEEEVCATFAHFHTRMEATRDLVPAGRLLVLRYEDLVADVAGSVERMYGELALGDYDPVAERVAAHMAAQRDYQPNRHSVEDPLREQISQCSEPYAEVHGYLS